MKISLAEYLTQTTPTKDVNVILDASEYKKGASLKAGIDTITQVFITDLAFTEMFPTLSNEYVIVNNSKDLMTTDSDGNPKKFSCFSLK